MRRALAIGVLATVVLGACGSLQPIDEALFLMTPRGVAVVRAGAAAPTFSAASGVPSRDWSTVVNTTWRGHVTRVSTFIPATGTKLWHQGVDDLLRTKVVSEDGNLAALGPVYERPYEAGRRKTRLVIAGSTVPTRTYELKGNIEPEAFSTDGSNVFVIQYSPRVIRIAIR